MSAAFEHFLTGKDRLSSLLNALPVHEAPEEFEHTVFEAVRAQRNADLPIFEPPASLQISFLQEAAQIDAAQELRRNAMLAALAGGQGSEEVLGSPLSEASEAWLKTQLVDQNEPAPISKSEKKTSGFWRDFGLVSAAALAAITATSLYLHLNNPKAAPAVAAAPQAGAPTPLHDKVPEVALAERRLPEEAPAVSSRLEAKELPPEERQHDKAALPKEHGSINTPRAKQDSAPTLNTSAARVQAEPPPAVQTVEVEAPASPMAVAAKPSLAIAPAPRAADTSTEGFGRAASSLPPPASSTSEKADAAGSVSKAKRSKALSAQHDSATTAQSCLVVALKYDPRLIAQHLEMTHCGQIIALKTAIPDAPETQDWAERFRLALPENKRPATLPLEKDNQVPFNLISIEALPAQGD